MVANPKLMVGFGDSFTAMGGSFFTKLSAKFIGITAVNMGISGSALFQRISELQKVYNYNPAIVVLEFGLNDEWRTRPDGSANTASQFQTDLSNTIDNIHFSTGAKVIVPQLLYYDPSNYSTDYETRLSTWRTAIQTVASQKADLFIDWHTTYYNEIQKGTNPATLYAAYDNVHPSDVGFQILADTIYDAMVSTGVDKYLTGDYLNRPRLRIPRVARV